MFESVGEPSCESAMKDSPSHCRCNPCAICGGKTDHDQPEGCRHGDDDQTCIHRFCDCGKALNQWESATGDMCMSCFDRINKERFGDKPYGVFIGYFEPEDEAPWAAYNLEGNHPLRGSTVAAHRFVSEGIAVPWAPSFEEWKTWPKNWRTH